MTDTPEVMREAAEEKAVLDMAQTASEWSDDEFASRIVTLLIHDKGLINAWQRTIELMVKLCRQRDKIIASPSQALVTVDEGQNTEQRKHFWKWLPLAYRDGHLGTTAKFTKYNMEVAHLAGWDAALNLPEIKALVKEAEASRDMLCEGFCKDLPTAGYLEHRMRDDWLVVRSARRPRRPAERRNTTMTEIPNDRLVTLDAKLRHWVYDMHGHVVKMITIDDVDLLADFYLNSRAAAVENVEEVAYQTGKRDGYEAAIQEIDQLTGGDGEYRYSTDHDPERHCPDPYAMRVKIKERFDAFVGGATALAGDVARLTAEVDDLYRRKDDAYLERNRLVALLAGFYPSGTKRTAIEGWDEEWHGCVYIDFPWGQASWHYHDSHAYLFDHLPPYAGEWNGHTTDQKYADIVSAALHEKLTDHDSRIAAYERSYQYAL